MKLKVFFLLLFTVILTPIHAISCVQWQSADGGNGHWYNFVTGSFTWDQALEDASKQISQLTAMGISITGMTSYLATVTSADEQTFLWTNFGSALSQSASAWLGGSDRETEGTWKWVTGPETGSIFTYNNWASGEPNDVNGGEDYLQLGWYGDGTWNDHGGPGSSINWTNGYIVEFSINTASTPIPAALPLLATGLATLGSGVRRKNS